MSRTITANTSSVVLNSTNPGDNPLTVNAGVTITTGGIYADTSQAWTVTNAGTVLATTEGVNFHGNGVLTNSGTASKISGGTYGLYARGGVTVTNQGSIVAPTGNAMFLNAGGKVINDGTASLIEGADYGIRTFGYIPVTVTNAGTITGNAKIGVYLHAGGKVTNAGAHAKITGGDFGIRSINALTVTNQGTISGSTGIAQIVVPATITNQGTIAGTSQYGIQLLAGGTVANKSTGRITGTSQGIRAYTTGTTITNEGRITSPNTGVFLYSGGTVTNSGTASRITGTAGQGIFALGSPATIINQGSIAGAIDAVFLTNGGRFENNGSTARVSGDEAVRFSGTEAGTVINQGTIAGTSTGVHFDNVNGNLLQLFPGAVITGSVLGGTGTDTLELATAAATGTITGLGGQFTDFDTTALDAGAHWVMTGSNTLPAGATIDLGTSATLAVTGTLTAPANLTLTGTGTLAAGRIEIGTAGAAVPNQLLVDAGQTLRNVAGAALAVAQVKNKGHVDGGIKLATAGTVINQGSISSPLTGVDLSVGGKLTNNAGALITSSHYGITSEAAAATILNQGNIYGANFGIVLTAGGTITNSAASGRISGYSAISAGGTTPGTVVNHGTIAGIFASIQFGNANGNLLQQFPNAVITGAVHGGTGTDTLELAAGIGTITGIGTQFTGFEQIIVDTGATWQADGANTLTAHAGLTLAGTGKLRAGGAITTVSNLTVTGTGTLAAGTGHIEIGTAATAIAGQIKIDAGFTLASTAVLSAANLKIGTGALFTGAGTVTGSTTNGGSITATGGTLTLAGNLAGGALKTATAATLALDGTANTAASVLTNGTVTLGTGAALDVTGTIDPASLGLFLLGNGAVLELAKDTGAGHKIDFLGPAGSTLTVDNAGLFGTNVGLTTYAGPTLKDFGGPGDTIDLKNLLFTGIGLDSYTPATGLLQLHSGANKATLHFSNTTLTGTAFHLTDDGSGHVAVTHT